MDVDSIFKYILPSHANLHVVVFPLNQLNYSTLELEKNTEKAKVDVWFPDTGSTNCLYLSRSEIHDRNRSKRISCGSSEKSSTNDWGHTTKRKSRLTRAQYIVTIVLYVIDVYLNVPKVLENIIGYRTGLDSAACFKLTMIKRKGFFILWRKYPLLAGFRILFLFPLLYETISLILGRVK